MSIMMFLVTALWWMLIVVGGVFIGWQCAVLIFIASVVSCVGYMLSCFDNDDSDEEIIEEEE